uniref:Odorant receptor n=1 Tax=Vespula pensylvanica TaxID=30213 RepID=A0A834N788_VESPE|nr:hypothetical protein H0235_016338 [Vespula pensylvanica]
MDNISVTDNILDLELAEFLCVQHTNLITLLGSTIHLCLIDYDNLINMSIQQKAKLIAFDITRDCVLNTPLPYCYIGRCLINEELDFGGTVKALDLTERAMRFVGTWPPKSFQPISVFFLIYLIIHCTLAIIDIAANITNTEYIISCLMENVFNVVAFLKICVCKIKRKSLAKFIDDIKSDFTLTNYYYEEEKMAFVNYNKFSRKFVIILLIVAIVAASMYYFFSLAMNVEIVLTNSSYGYRLPYRVWLLIEPTNVVTYVCLCFYQFLIIPSIVFGYVGTDCLFVSLVIHVSGLFSALSYKVKYVLNDTCDREKRLKQLIIRHVRLIRLSESLETDFNFIILLQLIATILQFCIVGYDALVPFRGITLQFLKEYRKNIGIRSWSSNSSSFDDI